ncbi:glycosyltransferase [Engelhardtia mirabilis]|uniref:Glycosyltransferase EpsH n=1 Tax=Engelhardtia mirabilis TaxID=2528011 RepID=A0A518BEW3_9BACT|nr:Putative glycosyltransferase EpsH [Planctomycetes bacterium Pla133]QDU99832.1 Putative glycosyltransferase EpsH [Planctomycetes bacterium Pla86]
MRDCLILGSGRSGTSMVAGSLARSGYFLGQDLYAPRACNPKGFFEAPEINGLNEELMAPAVPASPRLGAGQRWLARLPAGARLASGPDLDARLAAACAHRPFAYKDPRFSWTLPAWKPHLGDAGLVCVFRHPELTARSIVEECASAEYLADVRFDGADALALWHDLYQRLVEEHAAGETLLFLHYDQALSGAGLERLGQFLDAPVDLDFPERGLRRSPDTAQLGPELRELYAQLCDLAGHRPESQSLSIRVGAPEHAPLVAVVGIATDDNREQWPQALEQLSGQRGVRVETWVVDATRLQDLELDGARVTRLVRRSIGASLAHIAETSDAPTIAFVDPRASALPHRLLRSATELERDPTKRAVRCLLQQTGRGGQFQACVDPLANLDHAWPLWIATLACRREALAAIDRRAFRPALRELVGAWARDGQLGLVGEGLALADREELAHARAETAAQEHRLSLEGRDTDEAPLVSVMMAHHRRPDAIFETLESFCNQTLPPSALELIVIDDNSELALVDELRALELPVQLTVLRQGGGGAGNARNLGLPLARGRFVLFVNDDTIADPDLVERHLAAHAELARPVAIMGHFRQPTEALDNALLDLFERTTHLFGYVGFEDGAEIGGGNLYTCNVSVPLDAVRAIGGFDPEFSHYGCEDTDLGLRLEDMGVPLVYRAECRALHRHRVDEATITRRNPLVARAHARLFAKHPRAFRPWLPMDWSDEKVVRDRLQRGVAALDPLRRVVRSLGALDTGALRRSSPELGQLGVEIEHRLEGAFELHNGPLWWKGFIQGFEEQGAHRFEDLLARVPLELTGVEGPSVLLRVRRGETAWLALVERFVARQDEHDQTLLLWNQGDLGPGADAIRQAVAPALARAAQHGRAPRLALLDAALPWAEVGRVFAACDGWIGAAGDSDPDDADIAAGAGCAEVDVSAWRGAAPVAPLTEFTWRVLCRPDWSTVTDAATLAALAEPLMDSGDACLVFAHGPDEAPTDALLAELGPMLDALHGAHRALDVVLHECAANEVGELAAACSLWLDLPSGRTVAGAEGLERCARADELATGLRRLRSLALPALATAQLREPARDWRVPAHA